MYLPVSSIKLDTFSKVSLGCDSMVLEIDDGVFPKIGTQPATNRN